MAKPIIKLKTETGSKDHQLIVTGDMKAQYAHEIRMKFLELVGVSGAVHLDFSNVTAFDPSTIQLTYLLKKEMEREGRTVAITLPSQLSINTLLEKTGITKLL